MSKNKPLPTPGHYDPANGWDPFRNSSSNNVPCATATFRVKKDLMNIYTEPPPGIFVVADESNIMLIHALLIGPMDTPYEGGLFYFVLRCPSNYPLEPPKVKLMTTDAGRVRFNPNLYKNGKVCLSILGTWTGPAWSPAQQVASLLVSIQSLLNEKPYYNEPGVTAERCPGDADFYNHIIHHETLRVAVCGMLENDCSICVPKPLVEVMEKTFLTYYEQYYAVAESMLNWDGRTMIDPFGEDRGVFNFAAILKRLEKLHQILTERWKGTDLCFNNNFGFYSNEQSNCTG